MSKEKEKCKYKGCKNEVWQGVCNGYCVKHHNEVCMDNPTPSIPRQGWEKELEKAHIRHLSLNEGTELDGIVWVSREDVKSFISQLLQKEREEMALAGSKILSERTKDIREETLRSVLPKEEESQFKGQNHPFTNGFNSCRFQIIKTAQTKWGIKL